MESREAIAVQETFVCGSDEGIVCFLSRYTKNSKNSRDSLFQNADQAEHQASNILEFKRKSELSKIRTKNRARPCNPTTGRWMQKDPIGFRGGDTNLFRYGGWSLQPQLILKRKAPKKRHNPIPQRKQEIL